MRVVAISFASALALGGSGLADAGAAETAAPLIPDWKQSHLWEGGDRNLRDIYKLAVCARTQRRGAAEALLASAPGSAQEAALLAAAIAFEPAACPTRTRKPKLDSRVLVRGAFAEALYNGDRTRPRAASALPLAESFQPSRYGSEFVVARWVARCSVRREPRLAHEVVKWNPGAVGEARALRYLKPVFIACLPAGERLQVTRLAIRALIAEELYRASVTFKESFAHAHG